ncbi:hypothetical protein D9615_008060 [Tricholomella constricta]|uniref:TFIIS N-terminal domain-containing protein n=1 Tax=Tricholomella constricta TaxID=117010 RepID=A0A8H5LVW6_9AGAR|nr:hypothetical protein D9615_008060 [Tricholomella constricta]
MEHNLYTQWAQQSQLLSEPALQHESRANSLVDDWAKERSTPIAQPTTADTAATSSMDISDFSTLTDIGAPSTSSSSLTSSAPSFFSPYQHNSYFVPAPYNTLAYGSTWSSQPHVPLSNYSSLNGATTSTTPSSATSSAQQQQQQSPQLQHQQQQPSKQPPQSQSQPIQLHSSPQPMMIDPALTTLNGSRTTNLQHYPQANYSAQSSQPPQQQQQSQSLSQQPYPYSQLLHQSISYRTPTSYYQPQQQQHSTPQGTLSPQALHAPSSSMLSALHPSSFYGQTSQTQTQLQPQLTAPQKPTLTPQERKAQFLASIRPLLQSTAFTGAQAVNVLVDRITEYGIQEVEPSTRLEILTKMRDGAGNHYFRAWSENGTAIDITRDWLKAGFTAASDSPLVETIMPLLHIIDRLPLTVASLKASKLGKIVMRLGKNPPSPVEPDETPRTTIHVSNASLSMLCSSSLDLQIAAIKDMASNVERRWRSLLDEVQKVEAAKVGADPSGTEDPKAKKRKVTEPARGTAPPTKKVAVGGTTASKPIAAAVKKEFAGTTKREFNSTVKKEPSKTFSAASIATAVKDAKSDLSFFSAPKPKAKLPTFNKRLPGATSGGSAQSANVAQPSSINPFEEALKSMGKGRKGSPAVSTPPSHNSGTPPQQASGSGLTKKSTKKKTVTWAPQATLESIRLIEKAIYDDDPVDGVHMSHSLRDLDRGEGAALHAHIFEETVDWSEPPLIELPSTIQRPERGEGSEEKTTQEIREQTALGALYMTPAHIPESPTEPSHVISEEEVDKTAYNMTAGPVADAVFWNTGPVAPVAQSVADLVGQLAGGSMDVDPALNGTQFNGQGLDLGAVGLDATATLATIQSLPQDSIQRLLQQLQPLTQQQQQQQQPPPPPPAPPAAPPSNVITPRGEERITQQSMDRDSRIMKNRTAAGARVDEDAEEGEGGGEEEESMGIETIQDDLAVFLQQEGERTHPAISKTRRLMMPSEINRCKYGDLCDFSHENVFP